LTHESVDIQLTQPTVEQVAIQCQPSIDLDVNQVSIKMSIKGIDPGY